MMVRALLRSIVLAAMAGMLGAAIPVRAAEPAPEPWAERAGQAAAVLDARFSTADGWAASDNWERFPVLDALIDYRARSGDARWDAKIAATVRHRSGLALNDDALWAVIATVHAWRIERDPELLAWASATFGGLVGRYWDDHCGGGLWWDPARTYKNAITNELLLTAATELYDATGQVEYKAWALRSWEWFAGSGMIGADGLVNDGLDAQCRNNGAPRYTYNQGVLLGGLGALATITGDGQYRAAALRTALAATRTLVTKDGVLIEPSPDLGRDGPMFKGVFMAYLARLVAALPEGAERDALSAFSRRQGETVWAISDAGTTPIDGLWTGGSGQLGAAAQASGIEALLAAAGPAPAGR